MRFSITFHPAPLTIAPTARGACLAARTDAQVLAEDVHRGRKGAGYDRLAPATAI